MSEDDHRELSGLARSIDALFARTPRAPEAREEPTGEPPARLEVPGGVDGPSGLLGLDETDELGFSEVSDDATGTDLAELSLPEPSLPELSLAEPSVEAPQLIDAIVEGPAVEESPALPFGPPPLPELTDDLTAEAPEPESVAQHHGSLESAPISEGSDPEDFARAIESFLAGEPDAGGRVKELATGLRERLALDPLADAVERLVHDAGTPPDPTILDMASEIINPAVASQIVQRIGHERDEARKAEYAELCRRLGEIMARAFRGALTDATDLHARRAYYDMLIAMEDTSRPIIEAMIDDENRFLVRNAVAILGDIGGARAVELVTSALAHPDGRVRREALLSLAKLGDEESGALVVGFIEDPEPEVRVAAATAAGELKVDRALRPLLALLDRESDPDMLVPVLRALGQLGDPGAVPAIEKHAVRSLFSKPATEVRLAAYRALQRIGTPHARALVREALEDKEPPVQSAARELVRSETKK